jgi:Arc/MetJ family transcription regulator
MRTNIEIDDELMEQAMTASDAFTKRAVVEEALRLLLRIRAQGEILKKLKGIGWEGNLEESRASRNFD